MRYFEEYEEQRKLKSTLWIWNDALEDDSDIQRISVIYVHKIIDGLVFYGYQYSQNYMRKPRYSIPMNLFKEELTPFEPV